MTMKILVTGAAGQLGRAMTRTAPALNGVEVVAATHADLDLLDAGAVRRFVTGGGFTHIVNCAGYTAVDRAETEKQACTAANIEGPANLAAAADEAGARLVHVSTDYVFDGRSHRPYAEGDKPAPLQHYGATKRRGETRVLAACPEAIIVRTQWLYGLGGPNFVETMLRLSDQRGPAGEIAVVADQVGTPTCADDLARALWAIVTSRQWVPGIYHYSDEGAATWYDLAVAVMRMAGRSTRIIPIPTEEYPTPAARPAYALLDKRRIRATYGVETPHWADSLARYMAQRDNAVNAGQHADTEQDTDRQR